MSTASTPRQQATEDAGRADVTVSAPAPVRPTWRLVVHALVLVAGLAVIAWGAFRLTHLTITCRGVVMHPGDVCRTSSFSQLNANQVMSYELLHHQAEISQPFVIGAGVLIAAFGGLLLAQELRRRAAAPTA